MARVLGPGGYLVFADLTVPAWLARPLRPLAGRSFGVFTTGDLARAFEALQVQAVHRSVRWFQCGAVWLKPCQGSRRLVARGGTVQI